MIDILILIACAIIFYRAADMEGAPGFLWSAISVVVYLLTWLLLGWGFLGCIAGQVGIFIVITIVKMLRKS